MMTWIRRLLAAPVFEDEEKTRAGRVLNAVLLAFLGAAVVTVAAILAFYGFAITPEAAFTLLGGTVLTLVVGGLLTLARRGHVRIASLVMVSSIWLIMTLWICAVAGISTDSSPLGYALVIVLAGLLLGGRAAIAFTLLSALAVLGGYLAEVSGLLVVEEAPVAIMDLFLTIAPLALAGLLLRYAVNSLFEALERARRNERAQVEANRELQAIRASLEQRVADRTRDLARRSEQLQAATEVGHVATSVLESEALIQQVVGSIRQAFGLRYVGLFLVDGTGEWAVLQAAQGTTGEAEPEPSLPGRRLRVGEGLVGRSIALARPLVASEGEIGPALPAAGSEAALPLHSRGRVLGALALESDQPGTFDGAAVAIMEALADQVAVALDNTRLFAESQEALEAARRAYGELSREAWTELLRARTDWGYAYAHRSTVPVGGDWQPEMLQAQQTGQTVLRETDLAGAREGAEEPSLAIPLKVRDEVVGVLGFYKGVAGEVWTTEEAAVLETLVDQLGVTLESALLFQETQRRAVREQVIGEVTRRMRESLDVETVLRTAVDEMYQALGLDEIVIRLATGES